jgi:signal transduction histidine kinase
VWILGLVAVTVAAMGLHHAIRWYDRPVGGVLLNQDLEVTGFGMPEGDGAAQGLMYPDRVIAVDGVDLSKLRGSSATEAWDRAVESADRSHVGRVKVRVLTRAGQRDLELRIGRLEPATWWMYGGGGIFIGGLYVVAALTALTASPRGALSGAFGRYALLTGLFLFTFFDAFTSHALVPLFLFACGWAAPAVLALAMRLPDDVPLARRFPPLFLLLDALGVFVGGFMAVGQATGHDVSQLRNAWGLVMGSCGFLSGLMLLGRFLMASGRRRAILRIVVQSTTVPYALIGAGIIAGSLSSRGAEILLLSFPALALAPLATVVAFARNNIWGSRALLSRVVTRTVTGGLACAAAACLGGAFAASLGVPFGAALAAAGAGAAVSGPLLYLALQAVDRSFFPAVAEYKPTIEQLSEELTSIADPEEIASAVERTVRRWLPCDHVEFETCDPVDFLPPRKQKVELTIAAKFGGRTLGMLHVGNKRGGALFTTEDIDLLQTIANQAALAVAHARNYAELESRRRQQAAAWQVERLALVETLAAEVAHEVRYPINFFRSVFHRAPDAGATLGADEIEVGCEEVDRLERLVAGLRRLVGYRVERRVVSIRDLANHAEVLLRDTIGARPLSIDIPTTAAVRCDPDQVRQVVVNLVSNALDAGGAEGQIGIEWSTTEGGAELIVWDDGPGFDGDPSALFAPWFTTKPHGTGLGLAITQRIVRAHNWTIDAMRVDGRTRFIVTIPRADVVEAWHPAGAFEESSP